MSEYNNGWNEWSRHVLKELERLNGNYEQISKDVQELKSKVLNYSPEDVAILKVQATTIERDQKSLIDRDSDFENRLRTLEQKSSQFSGKWAILATVGVAVVAGLVSWIFSAFASPSSPDTIKKSENKPPVEHRLTANEIRELKRIF